MGGGNLSMIKDFKFSLPQKWEKLVILGHSNESNMGGLTLDMEIRLRAGYHLFNQEKVREIFLFGGGNDKMSEISEVDRMKNYLEENFKISKNLINTEWPCDLGCNTIENVANFIKKYDSQNQVVFLTSDYNVIRLKLILELLGKGEIFVLSAETILLEAEDESKEAINNYLNSSQYQNRMLYENYWLAHTIYDENYTRKARQELNISKNPIEYFQSQEKRLMENLEEEK